MGRPQGGYRPKVEVRLLTTNDRWATLTLVAITLSGTRVSTDAKGQLGMTADGRLRWWITRELAEAAVVSGILSWFGRKSGVKIVS